MEEAVSEIPCQRTQVLWQEGKALKFNSTYLMPMMISPYSRTIYENYCFLEKNKEDFFKEKLGSSLLLFKIPEQLKAKELAV